MLINEVVTLKDVISSDQYIRLLHKLKVSAKSDINVSHIKSQIIHSWKKGMKHRKHYDDLLSKINLNITELIS